MNEELRSTTPTIDIYIKLAQYPTLASKIRTRMREELFNRGIKDTGYHEIAFLWFSVHHFSFD